MIYNLFIAAGGMIPVLFIVAAGLIHGNAIARKKQAALQLSQAHKPEPRPWSDAELLYTDPHTWGDDAVRQTEALWRVTSTPRLDYDKMSVDDLSDYMSLMREAFKGELDHPTVQFLSREIRLADETLMVREMKKKGYASLRNTSHAVTAVAVVGDTNERYWHQFMNEFLGCHMADSVNGVTIPKGKR